MTIIPAFAPRSRSRAPLRTAPPAPVAPVEPDLFIEPGAWEPDLTRREAADLTALASAVGVRQSSRNGSYRGSW